MCVRVFLHNLARDGGGATSLGSCCGATKPGTTRAAVCTPRGTGIKAATAAVASCASCCNSCRSAAGSLLADYSLQPCHSPSDCYLPLQGGVHTASYVSRPPGSFQVAQGRAPPQNPNLCLDMYSSTTYGSTLRTPHGPRATMIATVACSWLW